MSTTVRRLAEIRRALRQDRLSWNQRRSLQSLEAILTETIRVNGTAHDAAIEHRELKRKRRRKRPLQAKPIRRWRDRKQIEESWTAHLSLDERIAGLRGMLMRTQSPARQRAIEARLLRLEAQRGFVDLTLD